MANIEYRIFLEFNDYTCAMGGWTSARPAGGGYTWCGTSPAVPSGTACDGATIEIPISKNGARWSRHHFSWTADVTWWGRDVFDQLLEFEFRAR